MIWRYAIEAYRRYIRTYIRRYISTHIRRYIRTHIDARPSLIGMSMYIMCPQRHCQLRRFRQILVHTSTCSQSFQFMSSDLIHDSCIYICCSYALHTQYIIRTDSPLLGGLRSCPQVQVDREVVQLNRTLIQQRSVHSIRSGVAVYFGRPFFWGVYRWVRRGPVPSFLQLLF